MWQVFLNLILPAISLQLFPIVVSTIWSFSSVRNSFSVVTLSSSETLAALWQIPVPSTVAIVRISVVIVVSVGTALEEDCLCRLPRLLCSIGKFMYRSVVSSSRPVVQNVVGVVLGLSVVTVGSSLLDIKLKRSSIIVRTLFSM